jgi:hypothetical protein
LSVKSIAPARAPAPGAFTVIAAVNVSARPKALELAEVETAVVVGAWFTLWVKALRVADGVKLALPP